MPELQPLRPEHAAALLAFESDNRAWFAETIADRGDEYFERFEQRLVDLLAEQDRGEVAAYVVVAAEGSVLGRINLSLDGDGEAVLGYRVARDATGRSVATDAVRRLCSVAATRHGVRVVRAATARDNVASRRVLEKSGFREVGPADPAEVGGAAGSWFERVLAPGAARGDGDDAGSDGRGHRAPSGA